ncbi:MAG: SpoIIE family protein phosphatase [Candidatus Eremiobacteraeota bacterium]|nr:SpoIIE family protein phosphatase [Candidatus Eremiobacteraeota bacterium]MCW5872846.1 SpoIIE family protein phosphatase [Candidatus Eremiobacteraeota bacterium]
MDGSTARILVVDDAPEVRLLVRGVLESECFTVDTVETAAAALLSLKRTPPDLMLLDLDLPDQQGSDLCRELRREGVDLPIVMLTSHNQGHERAAGLDCGADDYVGKPFLPEELLARVRAQLRREERFELRAEQILRERWDRIHSGLKLVQRSQQPFFSAKPFEHMDSAVRHFPVGRIGGDFYLLESIDDDRYAVAIGDVMGKGVAASLIMSWTLSLTHELMHKGLAPGPLMSELNRSLGQDLNAMNVFVAMFLGSYDRRSGHFEFCSAGIEPPIWFRHNNKHERIETEGIPVGVVPGFPYQQKTVRPHPGDQLFLFTDGLNDSVSVDDQDALMHALYRVLLKTRGQAVNDRAEALMSRLRQKTNGKLTLRDDLTFLLLEFPGGQDAN